MNLTAECLLYTHTLTHTHTHTCWRVYTCAQAMGSVSDRSFEDVLASAHKATQQRELHEQQQRQQHRVQQEQNAGAGAGAGAGASAGVGAGDGDGGQVAALTTPAITPQNHTTSPSTILDTFALPRLQHAPHLPLVSAFAAAADAPSTHAHVHAYVHTPHTHTHAHAPGEGLRTPALPLPMPSSLSAPPMEQLPLPHPLLPFACTPNADAVPGKEHRVVYLTHIRVRTHMHVHTLTLTHTHTHSGTYTTRTQTYLKYICKSAHMNNHIHTHAFTHAGGPLKDGREVMTHPPKRSAPLLVHAGKTCL